MSKEITFPVSSKLRKSWEDRLQRLSNMKDSPVRKSQIKSLIKLIEDDDIIRSIVDVHCSICGSINKESLTLVRDQEKGNHQIYLCNECLRRRYPNANNL